MNNVFRHKLDEWKEKKENWNANKMYVLYNNYIILYLNNNLVKSFAEKEHDAKMALLTSSAQYAQEEHSLKM